MISARRVVVCLAMLGALAVPGTVSAATPISLQVLVGDVCVSGAGGANKNVTATLRTPGGHKRDSFVTKSDPSGSFGGCFSFALPTNTINGGDLLDVSVGSQSRSLVVPKFIPDVDRVTNVISGKSDPNSAVSVSVAHHRGFKNSDEFDFQTNSDSNGDWYVDTSGTVNVIGGDQVIAITASGNDMFGAITSAPYIVVSHVNDIVQGVANLGNPVSVSLLDGHGAPKGTASISAAPFGTFTVALTDGSGDPAYPVGGDHVGSNVATDATLIVPVSDLHANPATDVVSGRCMANAPYLLIAPFKGYYGHTNATGRFMRDVSAKDNLHRGDQLRLVCLYPTGDIWVRTATVS
jgi:hypothetical protein